MIRCLLKSTQSSRTLPKYSHVAWVNCYGNKFGRGDTKDWTLENAKYTTSSNINKGVSENKQKPSRHNVRCNLLSVSPALTSFFLRMQFLLSNFAVKELKRYLQWMLYSLVHILSFNGTFNVRILSIPCITNLQWRNGLERKR